MRIEVERFMGSFSYLILFFANHIDFSNSRQK